MGHTEADGTLWEISVATMPERIPLKSPEKAQPQWLSGRGSFWARAHLTTAKYILPQERLPPASPKDSNNVPMPQKTTHDPPHMSLASVPGGYSARFSRTPLRRVKNNAKPPFIMFSPVHKKKKGLQLQWTQLTSRYHATSNELECDAQAARRRRVRWEIHIK